MSKVKLLTVCPNQHDATSFYRGIGPLLSLAKDDSLEIINSLDKSWSAMKHVSAVFLQRPHIKECVELLIQAKKAGKRVWIDYDDLLTELPKSNPFAGIYNRKDIQENVRFCLRNADVVTVSTEELKQAYSLYATNIQVIPNAWDDDLFPKQPKLKPVKNRVVWRGSGTHDSDLMSVLLSLQSFAKEDQTEWRMIGQPYWLAVETLGSKCKVVDWRGDILDYFWQLAGMNASVIMAPLADNKFNRCKSNIAWIENSWAGGVAVAPDWDEWRRPGIFNYTHNFKESMDAALNCDVAEVNRQSWEYISSELRLSKINELRRNILKNL